jgi:hypothetical protein
MEGDGDGQIYCTLSAHKSLRIPPQISHNYLQLIGVLTKNSILVNGAMNIDRLYPVQLSSQLLFSDMIHGQ